MHIYQALVSQDRGPQRAALMVAEHDTAARVEFERRGFTVHALWLAESRPDPEPMSAQEHNRRVPPVQPHVPPLPPAVAARWYADWTGEYPIGQVCCVCQRRVLGPYTELPDGRALCPECEDDHGMTVQRGAPPVRPVFTCTEVA